MKFDPSTPLEARSGSGRVTLSYVQKLQKKAKTLSRAPGMAYAKALDAVAVEAGFHHWHDVAAQHKAYLAQQIGSAA